MSSAAVSPISSSQVTSQTANSSIKPSYSETEKPKPCCVCKPEKTARDDCMLFSKSDNPAESECKSLIDQYRSCMAGYGFKV
ncbi:Cytochrome C oxidase copper chaperone family protein [Coccidioides posadasii C735 delta SOWgp]|uniref:Cox17p n=2 Tax=Coccidioides posadasii TaxID=199306 RepID=A0A0J6HYY4_COCPO|nr:Cytochrome C oxidase copper chaperone family protein [Coccidioides posadasii C735 delta SOWgp]EER28713.1 Cytochrome C oxidase copper chaperone family protein [Coccidioides posadasii C735 delta SOWgp]KMM64177.1 Cox17p [Coccidioides posadasii RMSCC 3488]|eukprot:XP_003070858.1 Cytochrome C oxidase copper chaperone family protein [Coccidioides posadasii C735 delta SOWgp]